MDGVSPAEREENEEKQMAKKHDTVLTDGAGKIGSMLGIIAAEAANVVRPLRAKRAEVTSSCSRPQDE